MWRRGRRGGCEEVKREREREGWGGGGGEGGEVGPAQINCKVLYFSTNQDEAIYYEYYNSQSWYAINIATKLEKNSQHREQKSSTEY